MDIALTPELIVEGHARDLVRQIQELRKEAGLHISDRIVLSIGGADQILAGFSEYIKGETLAVEITTAPISQALITKEIALGEMAIGIGLALKS